MSATRWVLVIGLFIFLLTATSLKKLLVFQDGTLDFGGLVDLVLILLILWVLFKGDKPTKR